MPKQIISKIKKCPETIIVAFLALSLFLSTWFNIGSWQYTFIGDEWAFYDFAKAIVLGLEKPNLLSLFGVYGSNPVLASYWQALSLKTFGINHLSWRLSNAVLLIPTTFAFFYWVKTLFDKKISLFSTLFFTTSSFLFGYFKLGYPNPISLLFFCLVLLTFTKTLMKKSEHWPILCGLFLGLSFYLVYGSLFPFIIAVPIFVIFTKKNKTIKKKPFFLKNLIIYTIAIICILPVIINIPNYLKTTGKSSFVKPEYDSKWQILTNSYKTSFLFFKNYDYFHNHFIYGAYFDLISQIFIVVGLIFLINVGLNKTDNKKYSLGSILFVSSYIATIIIISITNPYKYTPATRGHLLIPFGATLAGLGFNFLLRQFKYVYLKQILLLTYAVVLIINLYKSNVTVLEKTGASSYSHIMRYLQQEIPLTIIYKIGYAPDEALIKKLESAYLVDTEFQIIEANKLNCDQLKNNLPVIYKNEVDDETIINKFIQCRVSKYALIENYK